MTTRLSNLIILIILVGFIVFNIFFPANKDNGFISNLINISDSIIAAIILYGLLNILQNINKLKFYFLTQFIYRNTQIRLSIAYLYRIKIDGKYLLVKSRTRKYFQPVGGAFKTLPGSEKIFEKLKVTPDRLIQTEDGIAKGDLRVYLNGINVIEFLEWFNSKKDREISPWREFCEELISTDILPWKPFRFIDYKFKGTIQTPIITLDSGDKGMFLFEIYDLIPSDTQKPILKDLLDKGNTKEYIWVDEYLIKRLGHSEEEKIYKYDIAPHTKWALNLKWSKD